MNVLVVGAGGREHALAWKLAQSPQVETVYCSPGNAGMSGIECVTLPSFDAIADFARDQQIGLVMIGPEAPLCDGLVDHLRERGVTVFGPTRDAAQLEGSKTFAKAFMHRHGIPTARAESFTERTAAEAYIRSRGVPIVVKADGLAAGKGVTVAHSLDEALDAVRICFSGAFGDAGAEVLVEDCLEGEEASILAFVDNHTIRPLVSSQDHKPVGDGDVGPNTGGMGAYSPAPVVDDNLWDQIRTAVLAPFLHGCQADGLDFRGIIYAGIMVTPDGVKVLEFNVRFGDPETQAVLYRMKSDLCEALLATVENRLADYEFVWSDDPAVCVVMASGGYPGAYEKGKPIRGLETAEKNGAMVFHAGTERRGKELVTAGGRVLGVTASGANLEVAVARAYQAVDAIEWDGAFCRRDIAHRAFKRC